MFGWFDIGFGLLDSCFVCELFEHQFRCFLLYLFLCYLLNFLGRLVHLSG